MLTQKPLVWRSAGIQLQFSFIPDNSPPPKFPTVALCSTGREQQ